jgi:hypothetical protein
MRRSIRSTEAPSLSCFNSLRMGPLLLLLLHGLLALDGLVAPAEAAAQDTPRCAVAPFEGDVVLRRSFMRALEENGFVQVIGEDEVDRAAEGGAGPRDIAQATGADLVITGEASGSRRARRLELVAYDASGRQIATETIRMRPGGAGRRSLDEGISNLLSSALPALGATAPAEEPAETTTTGGGPTRSSGGGGGGSTRVPTSPTPTPAHTEFGANPVVFVARLGLVLRTRDAEAVLSSGMPRSWRSEPLYAELHVGLELRPLAQNDDLSRGLFIRGEFANAVALGTRAPSGDAVDTHFFRFAADIGYLLPVGAAVEVGLGVGFGWDAYNLGSNFEFPSVELPHVRPALRGRLRLVDELVVIGLESGLRIAVDRGALSAAFGRGDTIGFDVGASISGALDFGLAYNLDLTWAGFWHGFSGGGTLGNGQSGTEQGLRVLLSAGYAFR